MTFWERLKSSEYQIGMGIFIAASVFLWFEKIDGTEWIYAALGAASIMGAVRRVKAAQTTITVEGGA